MCTVYAYVLLLSFPTQGSQIPITMPRTSPRTHGEEPRSHCQEDKEYEGQHRPKFRAVEGSSPKPSLAPALSMHIRAPHPRRGTAWDSEVPGERFATACGPFLLSPCDEVIGIDSVRNSPTPAPHMHRTSKKGEKP